MTDTASTSQLIYRRTKIVATLGPTSSDDATISELICAGVNVFRLNMSHGTHDEHRARYGLIRAAALRNARPVAILADLCGPKIRVGLFEGGGARLETGSTVAITTEAIVGTAKRFTSQYGELCRDVVVGSRILLDDGNLELRVETVLDSEITCLVVQGGFLKDKKGMNLPDVAVSAKTLTDKDRVDALFAAQLGVDFVALSFVRSASDVYELRRLLAQEGSTALLVAKIEKPEAVAAIDEILDAADAIMVARGDLGVELDMAQVPNIQEELVDKARAKHKPVIVATQMLESMITAARPTRAEVTDVANAVRSGADAVMLSAETAAGQSPVGAVRTMDLIVRRTEEYLSAHGAFGTFDTYTPTAHPELLPRCYDAEEAVALSVANMSRCLPTSAIVANGVALPLLSRLSSTRPSAIIVAQSACCRTFALGCLCWGVLPIALANEKSADARELVATLKTQIPLERTDGFWLIASSNVGNSAALCVVDAKSTYSIGAA